MAGLFVLGGSSFYTLLLLQSLKAAGVLKRFQRIALFGRNAARLDLIAEAGMAVTGGRVPIVATTRIEDCRDPAYDILFNQMRFGGLGARDGDERLAIDLGLPADETIGIVGVSNAIRTITGMAGYLSALRAKPGRWSLVNFTNPCSILCQYLTQQLDVPVIGVCDYPAMMRAEIAATLGAAPETVDLDYFGLNHFGIVHGVRVAGEDRFAAARAAPLSFKPACNRYSPWLLNVSWSFVHEREAVVRRQRAVANRASTLIGIEAQCDALLATGERAPAAYLALLGQRRCDWYNLAVSPVLARLTGDARVPVFVNCTAGDILDIGLENSVIEAGGDFADGRFAPIHLPQAVRHSPEWLLIRLMKIAETMLLDGILGRDPDRIVAACLANPMIGALEPVEAYFARLRATDAEVAALWAAR